MHAAADSMTPAYNRQHLEMGTLVEENMVHIGRLMGHRPEEFGLIREIADHAKNRIVPLLPCNPPAYGICHGDLHGNDVRYDANGMPTLLDFDSSGCGWRAVIQLTPAIRHIFLTGHVLRHTTVYEGWNWANDGFIDWHLKWFRHWHEHGMN